MIGDGGSIDDLNLSALTGFVNFGRLILSRQQLEYGLVILHVAQSPDVFDLVLLHLAFWNQQSIRSAVRRGPESYLLGFQPC